MKIIPSAKINDSGSFKRASEATYWNKAGVLTVAPVDVARFSFDPSNLDKPPVLLLETAQEQLLRYTDELDNGSAWGGTSRVVTANATVAPNGSIVADRVTASTDAGLHNVEQEIVGRSYSNGEKFTFSVFARAEVFNRISLGLYYAIGGATGSSISFNLANGTIDGTAEQIAAAGAKIQAIPGGWYRCSFVGKVDKGTEWPTRLMCRVALLDLAGNASYTNASAPGVFLYGANLTPGEKLGSYTYAGSAPTVRAADVSNIGLISPILELEAPYYSPTKVYAIGERMIELSDHKVYESGNGTRFTGALVEASSPCNITLNGHGLVVGTPIVFDTTLLLPTGISTNTVYYVLTAALNTFTISATKGGPAIITTGVTRANVGIVANGNMGRSAPDEDRWIDTGCTNKWAFLDNSIESQTVMQDTFTAALRTPDDLLIDTVVIQNIEGASMVRVALVTPDEGIVYDRVVNMSSAQDIRDPYAYTFEPIDRDTDLVLIGLPLYAGAYVSVTMLGANNLVKCGLAVIGRAKHFGATQAGMSLGMLDYSKKEKNDYGNTKVKEGAFSGTMKLSCFVDRSKMNQLIKMLVGLRATPAVYIGDDALTCSVQYGYYNDYTMGAEYVEHSVLHIEIESLT